MLQISSRLGREGCCYSTLGYSLLYRHLVGWGDSDVVQPTRYLYHNAYPSVE
jgi:hypothetical protein